MSAKGLGSIRGALHEVAMEQSMNVLEVSQRSWAIPRQEPAHVWQLWGEFSTALSSGEMED
jgi:hypothetical protein